MGSRLQKLLKLLESSNDGTRKAAAQQVCEIAKAHPSQLVSITRKVHSLLYSPSWDTRTAAAATIGLLAEAFPHHSVRHLAAAAASAGEQQADAQQAQQLQDLQQGVHITLQTFDLPSVLSKGEPLLASGGQEYDLGDTNLPMAERVAKQREQIKKRLGLGKGLDDVLDTEELVNEEDITAALQEPSPGKGGRRGRANQQGKGGAATPEKQAASELLGHSDSLSARERNKLKRKAKAMERQSSVRLDNRGRVAELLAEQRSNNGRETSPGRGPQSPTAAAAAAAVAAAGAAAVLSDEQAAEQDLEEWHCAESGGWPFQRLADQLCCDVLSPVWTVRHGAAAGLRELLREQAAAAAVEVALEDINSGWACAGNSGLRKLAAVSAAQVEAAAIANAAWLEDVVMHLLCVLALDRFADYVSDQVVVPVRETAAQALAAALQATSLYSLQRVLELLSCMYNHHEWHVRHGAYTGIKYLLASRPDVVGDLLQLALPVLMAGLQDKDDSVQAAAAEALVPLAPMLLQLQAEDTVSWLRSTLWALLANMEEELSVATSSALSLLAALYSAPAAVVADANLAAQLPILWPFLSHTLTSARLAAVTCLASVVAAKDAAGWTAAAAAAAAPAAAGAGSWLRPVVGPCLRVVLQSLVLEKAEPVRQMLLQAWRALLQHSRAADIAAGLSVRDMRAMLNLLCTPCWQGLDTSVLVVPLQRRLVPWSSQEAELAGLVSRPAKRAKSDPAAGRSMIGLGSQGSAGGSVGGGANVAECAVDPEGWPGMSDSQAAVHTRLLASRALAELCDRLTGQEPPVLPGLVQQQLQQLAASSRVSAALVILQWLLLVAGRIRQTPDAAAAAAADGAAALAASSVALAAQIACCVPEQLPDSCLAYLGAPTPSLPSLPATEPYTELAAAYGHMRRELYRLMNLCLEAGVVLPTPEGIPVEAVTPDVCLSMLAAVPAAVDTGDVRTAKAIVQATAAELQATELYHHTSALLALASAVVAGGRLPPKLNCVLQNLMAGLRREPVQELQAVAAEALAELMVGCTSRQPCPNDKLLKNLCGMLCGDPAETPCAAAAEDVSPDDDVLAARVLSHSHASTSQPGAGAAAGMARSSSVPQPSPRKQQQQQAEAAPDPSLVTARVGAEAALRAICGRFGAAVFEQLPSLWQHMAAALEAQPGPDGAPVGDPQALIHAIQVVKAVVPALHDALLPRGLQLLPALCSCLKHGNAAVRLAAARCLATLAAAHPEAVLPPLLKQAAPLLDGTNPLPCRLGAVEVMAALMQQLQRALVPYTVLLVVPLLRRMSDPAASVRRRAALCFGGLTALLPLAQGMPLPSGLDEAQRRAAEQDVEFLGQLLDNKRVEDYSLPVKLKVEMRRYQQEGVNWLSFLRRFGLSGVLADDMGLGKTLQATTIMACSAAERRQAAAGASGPCSSSSGRDIGQQQQAAGNGPDVSVKQEPGGSEMQDAGIVQQPSDSTTAAAVTELNQQQQQQQAVKQEPAEGREHLPDKQASAQQQGQQVKVEQQQPQPQQPVLLLSLVVCPSTLVGHWAHEVNKYVEPSVLRPLAVSGTPAERAAAVRRLQGPEGYNVVVISYESLRSDIDWAARVMWDYVILDEGHVIRSTKSKLAQAVKRLQAQHRLVLSGTPIQNSALELWSLFDFLMPGFLGAERDFQARFGKLVAAARYSKKGSQEAEAGMLALDALHKQVMPFILRRTKAQVLQDLPPKIVTDMLCCLSPIQHALYEDFQDSQALSEVRSTLAAAVAAEGGGSGGDGGGGNSKGGAQHIFSALLYLRKLCSHPLLVLDWSVPAHREACQSVLGASTQAAAEVALRGLEHAPKLLALQDILVQCGIVQGGGLGSSGGNGSGDAAAAAGESDLSEGSSDSGHRLLVFAQLKGMLDLVESLLLQPLGVSSLRLDGSVDASARFGVVQRFNTDPTIQVLLLTTHVGGLGLNLTSADTVVFLEHDWNPMKDLQAMDRAHRIGQTRTVNVYRLLMQDTLEQRVMSLQQFKLDVANAVVNSDNVSMAAMDTGQLLDLFGAPTQAAQEAAAAQQAAAGGAAAAAGNAAAVEAAAAAAAGGGAAGKKKSALQSMLDGMGELWDDSQYAAEFDMQAFAAKLAAKSKQA